MNIGGNYTWSHCLGLSNSNVFSQNEGGAYLDSANRDFDRGNCTSDRRHVLNLTAVADTPQFANVTMRRLATGWRFSGIYRLSTGNYLTIASGPAPEAAFRHADAAGAAVVVERARGIKCARSWRYFDPATADPEFPDVTPRDAKALREWRARAS